MHSVLNEGGLVDLFDLIMGGARNTRRKNEKNGRVYLKGSISKYTNNLTMSFPMLCDATLPMDTCTMIATANEYNVADMLQKLFSSISIKGDNGIEILRSFYKGIDNNMGMEDMIEFLDNLVLGENAITDPELRDAVQEICMELRNPKYFKKDSISENSLSNYLVYGNDDRISVRESDAQDEYYRDKNRREQEKHDYDDYQKMLRDKEKHNWDRNQEERNKAREIREKEKHIWAKNEELRKQDKAKYDKAAEERNIKKHEWEEERNTRENERHNGLDYASIKSTQDSINRINQNRLVPQEVKKQNQLQGTLMVINFVDVLGDGKGQIAKTFVAGVKSRVIPVEAMDIVERLAEKNPQRNGSGFSKLIKFTTGEISLAKSISDSFAKAKLKAKNNVKNKTGIGRMWDVLEKRGIANNASKIRRVNNDASAITGLVISQETVNYIKNSYNFDIERVKNAKTIMDAYNLMSIFIADEANEVVKSIYDGNNQYEYLSYTSMHKDVGDKNYKKIINLLNTQR
jgi:hypothetical protein